MSLGYQHGYNIPVYDLSPKTEKSSSYLTLGLRYRSSGDFPILERLYGQVDFSIQAIYQNLGNDEVMGDAYAFLPDVRFRVKEWRRSRLLFGGGLGLGATTKPYDKIDNPTNQALGTILNIYAQMHLEYAHQLSDQWMLSAELGMHHLSNSFFSYPNLGVNIPSAGFSLHHRLNYGVKEKQPQEDWFESVPASTKWRPFVRGVYGVTERGFDGPYYAVYGGSLGLWKKLDIHRIVLLGGEYLFDESSHFFLSRAKGEESAEVTRLSTRWSVVAGHEYLFGYMSFVTEVGVYLSDHFNRQSRFSTKIGLNFFPMNVLFKPRHQVALGAFVRAYGLRADFFEVNLSYRL